MARVGMAGRACIAALACCFAVLAGAQEPIVSRAQFDAWLAAHPGSPINALSPGARERFLVSLRFDDSGLVALDANDLADELDDARIHDVLAPFGARVLTYAPRSHAAETRAYDRGGEGAAIGAIEQRYNAYYVATAHPPESDAAALQRQRGEAFDTHLGGALYAPAALRRVTDHELRLLRRAARDLAIATRLPNHLAAFDAVFAERARRKLVSTDDLRSLRDLYLLRRRFTEARRLASAYPGSSLAPLPQFRDDLGEAASRPTVWRFDASGKRLTRASVDLAPLQIIVAASCAGAREAARDIGVDPLLAPVFASHAQWLVPAPGEESTQDAQQWNRELPAMPVAMIYDLEEWSVLPRWDVPTFFIVRDGQVVDSWSGWVPGDARTRDALVAALRRAALLPAQ